ncbi:MAG: hypothetical protein J5743_06140, partial [Victivallales bacterium]|nr:hypothetical protein [Victivallales bacterium]
PIEFSLVPAAIQRQQNLTKKKPAFIIAGLTILLTLGVFWFSTSETKKLVEQANYQMKDPHEKLEKAEKMVKTPDASAASKVGQYNALGEVILQRARWSSIYNEIYRLKPNNLWINSITPILTDINPYEPETVELPVAGEGGGEDGMMSMGSPADSGSDMFSGMEGESSNPLMAEGPLPISGLEIVGTCVQPYPSPRSMAWSATMGDMVDFDGIFQLEAKSAPAEEPAETSEKTEEAAASDDGEEKAEAPVSEEPKELSPEDIKKAEYAALRKKIASAQSPELAFEAALRMSPLFDADPAMTVITMNRELYAYPQERFGRIGKKVARARAFKMQVKFATSLEVYNIPSASMLQRGMGMDGMMGSPN